MEARLHQEYLETIRDEIIQARRRLAELSGEVDGLQRRVADLERLDAAVAPLAGVPALTTQQARAKRSGTPHADRAAIVLREAGRALTTDEIIEGMRARGFPLPANPRSVKPAIYCALSRRKHEILMIDKGTWMLANGSA